MTVIYYSDILKGKIMFKRLNKHIKLQPYRTQDFADFSFKDT